MRLDRFLSHATGLSRSQAQQAVRRGEVRVSGRAVTDPGAPVTAADAVEYAGRRLAAPGHRYLMLNKPAGYVCATRDPGLPTVLELIDVPRKQALHIVGRLDLDATGLVLLTDDGDWSHRVTAPRRKVAKRYRVTLAEPLSESGAVQLAGGVMLRNEKRRCRPATIERITDTEIRITVTEGKYHQVKRMFAAVGNRVTALHRERIGAVQLDPALKPGQARPLTAQEVQSFRSRPEAEIQDPA
jgi:16S rRNA pseudouridine516 synthase